MVLVWMIGRAMGLPVPPPYYWILVPMVSLLTMLPISLNGMGVREGGDSVLAGAAGQSRTGTALSLAFCGSRRLRLPAWRGVGFYLWGPFPRVEVRADDESVGSDSDQGRAGQSQAAA